MANWEQVHGDANQPCNSDPLHGAFPLKKPNPLIKILFSANPANRVTSQERIGLIRQVKSNKLYFIILPLQDRFDGELSALMGHRQTQSSSTDCPKKNHLVSFTLNHNPHSAVIPHFWN